MKESGPLDIEVVKPGGTVIVLALTGEIDIYTAPRLRDALDESIGGGAQYQVQICTHFHQVFEHQ